MASEFIPDPNLDSNIRQMAEMTGARRAVADRMLNEARDLAPVRSGDYRNSLQVVTDGGQVAVVSDDWKAHWIEFGSINNEAFAPIRRAAERVGQFDEAPKP